MASTSASSVQKSFRYDVFLSFRGEDTRKGFVDHLYKALQGKGIITYKDDEKIQKGERISEQLIRSIQDSRFYVIVFSKNYASSSWCLTELAEIMECQKMAEHTAYPVFYDVEPTEIRNQSGPVGEAFARHYRGSWTSVLPLDCVGSFLVSCFSGSSSSFNGFTEKKVGIWRNALKDAAGLAGWELKNTVDGHEAKFVEKIIEEISPKLHFISLNIDDNLVGMETRLLNVVSYLKLDSDDVHMIGIRGIGGGGKTTLARAIFNHISIHFDSQCFVENVREGSKGSGLKELQKQVLQDVLNDQKLSVKTMYDGNMMKKMMCGRKVLFVLDDVDHIDQLKALAGSPNWFKAGSRIIITTRDEQVLVAHGIHRDNIYDVNLLTSEEAICLFSRCAFKRESPIQEYEELSINVVHYAAGLPLTITVLGSFLCGRDIREWEDALERLKVIPWEETLTRLEISYDGLENDQKEIFLDVACLLKGMERETGIRVLESRGFHAEIGLRVLEQKSLLTVSDTRCLQMHDHLEEMGKNIVRRSHPGEPNKHNRLWIREEIDDILENDLGTNGTSSIKLHYSKLSLVTIMYGLRKMEDLRVLWMHNGYRLHKPDPTDQYLPNTLQSLYWGGHPFMCLPKTFQANNLVHLEMSDSAIAQLWEGGENKVLNKLKFLVIKYSNIRSIDMGMTPNLQVFCLKGCMKFEELSMPVACPKLKIFNLEDSSVSSLKFGSAPCLENINIKSCFWLEELHMPVEHPKLKFFSLTFSMVSSLKFGLAPCLENLNIEECKYLVELDMPVECPRLKLVDLRGSMVRSLNIGSALCLETINLKNCNGLVELHIPVECPRLKHLDLRGSKVSSLNIMSAPCLETLNLNNCNCLVELHIPVECPKLELIDLCCSKVSCLNIVSAPSLETLNLKVCNDLVELHLPVECPKLKLLDLCGSKVSSLNVVSALCLETLNLQECNNLVELHIPVECPKLELLDLRGSKVSRLNIVSSPCLETLYLEDCNDLVELHLPVECPKLKLLNLCGSKVSSLNIVSAPCLKTLDLENCNELVELHIPVECPKLKLLDLRDSKVSRLNIVSAPCLKRLFLQYCKDLVELHIPVECPKLELLNLHGSKVSSVNIVSAPCLTTLYLGNCNDLVELHIPVECVNLEHLDLRGSKVSSLNIVSAPYLETLDLENCNDLAELHIPVECLKELVYLDLGGCSRFDKWYKFNGRERVAAMLNLTAESLDSCQLHPDSNLPKFRFKCLYNEALPSSSGNLEKLLSFGLCACTNLESFSASICGLQGLTELTLEGSIPEVPKDLYLLESLKHLTLSMKEIKHLPESICMLKHLKSLELRYCLLLEQLPNDFGRLESLEELHLTDCMSLRDIPSSICNMKSLKYIDLHFCFQVEKLPDEFGRLESLEEINIEGAGIRRLPQSIFELKGLYIVGSARQLESYGFTSVKEISTDNASCYIRL